MAAKKPNILILWGDDIGWWNISYNSRGQMGYRTPNIDRVANEGVAFTDYYAQQSCTAGRAAFITGQNPIRTGLTKVGMPGADQSACMQDDPTMAELLKPMGYATGQFGKNHFGDRDEHLPTMHGFDEFFGNLYHLNAEEEPELPDYPKNPEFKKKFGPRAACCTALPTARADRPSRHGAADQEAHGDHRRRGDRCMRCASSTRRTRQRRSRSSCLVQHDGDALPHPLRRQSTRARVARATTTT